MSEAEHIRDLEEKMRQREEADYPKKAYQVMSEKLLPCPFCGSPGQVLHLMFPKNPARKVTVRCSRCKIEILPKQTERAAIRRWNTRAKQAGSKE